MAVPQARYQIDSTKDLRWLARALEQGWDVPEQVRHEAPEVVRRFLKA